MNTHLRMGATNRCSIPPRTPGQLSDQQVCNLTFQQASICAGQARGGSTPPRTPAPVGRRPAREPRHTTQHPDHLASRSWPRHPASSSNASAPSSPTPVRIRPACAPAPTPSPPRPGPERPAAWSSRQRPPSTAQSGDHGCGRTWPPWSRGSALPPRHRRYPRRARPRSGPPVRPPRGRTPRHCGGSRDEDLADGCPGRAQARARHGDVVPARDRVDVPARMPRLLVSQVSLASRRSTSLPARWRRSSRCCICTSFSAAIRGPSR